jgi:eukaryotic-like serine/threonine-protein kinase
MSESRFAPIERQLQGEYTVLGELGTGGAYLARERTTGQLVALRLDKTQPDVAGDAAPISVHRTLGVGVPAARVNCPLCRSLITDWRRFCPTCGGDLSEVIPAATSSSASGAYDVLGEMERDEGAGRIQLARDRTTGVIVALSSTASNVPGQGTGPAPATGAAGEALTRVCPSCGSEYAENVRFCPKDATPLTRKVQSDDLVGQVVARRYYIQAKLGAGGMGEVYLAEHVRMGRRCAIKIMHRSLTSDPDSIGRFSREAATAGRIKHPRVVEIYDFGETEDGVVFLAMEFVDGEPLSKILARGPLPIERAVEIARQITEALTAAHRSGVVHRDLKPDNLLITRSESGADLVKVVDFGIAKAMEEQGASITRTGFVVGTARYMSPEQLIGEPADPRSDLYALACILFELLTGVHPWGDGTALLTRRLIEAPPHPRDKRAEISPELDQLIVRALARDPAERFQTAQELGAALQAVGARAAVPSTPVVEPGPRRPNRRQLTVAATACVGVLALAGALVLFDVPVLDQGPRAAQDSLVTVPPPVPQPPGPAAPETATVPAPRVGHVALEGNVPSGATILVDGRAAQVNGNRVTMPVGAHRLEIVAPGFQTATRTVQVQADGASVWRVALQPSDAPVPVATTGVVRLGAQLPAGSQLLVDGRRIEVSGNRVALPPGTHQLEVQAAGFESLKHTITVSAGGESVWTPVLTPLPTAIVTPPVDPGPQPPPVTPEAALAKVAAGEIERLVNAVQSGRLQDIRRADQDLITHIASERSAVLRNAPDMRVSTKNVQQRIADGAARVEFQLVFVDRGIERVLIACRMDFAPSERSWTLVQVY